MNPFSWLTRWFARNPVPYAGTSGPTGDTLVVSTGLHRFSWDLYGNLCATPGNLFFSPFSIHGSLSMAMAGAAGGTATEFSRVLRVPTDIQDHHAGVAAFAQRYADSTRYELVYANRIFASFEGTFKSAFRNLCERVYQAPVETVAFPEPGRTRINSWVADKTRKHITDLIPVGGVDALTTLVLVNAVYFKGSWALAFDRAKTRNNTFRTNPNTSVTVPFMTQTTKLRVASMDTFTMVELPYAGSELAMDVLIPHAVDGLDALERELDAELFHTARKHLNSSLITLILPRFSLRWGTASLKAPLEALGLQSAFSANNADLSEMSDQPLFISDVLHQAFVSVDESGTVAAAATAVKVARGSVSSTKTVMADHPFLFLIRDVQTDAVLFMGRVVDPR